MHCALVLMFTYGDFVVDLPKIAAFRFRTRRPYDLSNL